MSRVYGDPKLIQKRFLPQIFCQLHEVDSLYPQIMVDSMLAELTSFTLWNEHIHDDLDSHARCFSAELFLSLSFSGVLSMDNLDNELNTPGIEI